MTTAIAPDLKPDRRGIEGRPTPDRDPADPTREQLDGHSFDPTQGRRVGSHPYEDPTQGRRIGSHPYDDPTQGRQIGSNPYDDPIQAR
jgi:hypothetical protein